MSKYLYFAIFDYEDGAYHVSFPDLSGCLTFGDNMSEALHLAKNALEGHMLVAEDYEDEIPVATNPSDITIPEGALLIPIEADTKLVRIKKENKYIKKTLTIPQYLNVLGEEHGINFSQVLQDALKKRLT